MSDTEHEQDEGDAHGDETHVPVVPADDQDAEEAEEAESGDGVAATASAAQTEQEIEKAQKLLKREATAHANRISKIMGEDALGLVVCARCEPLTPGFHFPPNVVPVSDEQRDAVLASIGMGDGAAPPLREAEGVEMCPRCDGWGQLKYPTRVVHVKEQMCPKCQGQGYVSVQPPAPAVVTFETAVPTTYAASSWGTNGGVPDQWGRAPGHPHYNLPPASVGV